jgi:hypothetical protein
VLHSFCIGLDELLCKGTMAITWRETFFLLYLVRYWYSLVKHYILLCCLAAVVRQIGNMNATANQICVIFNLLLANEN